MGRGVWILMVALEMAAWGKPRRQATPTIAVDTQATPIDSLSEGAGRGLGVEQVQQLSRTALTQIALAMGALEDKDRDRADQALSAAAGHLRQIYDAVPSRDLLRLLAHTDAADDLAPILAQVHQQAIYLDPRIVDNVDQADEKSRGGDRAGAQEDLAEAQRLLAEDVASAPVEDAYARVVAASADLRRGDAERALRLLRQVPNVLDRVDVSAPMVPVRFSLRAAAAAADKGKWDQARTLMDQATGGLDQIVEVARAVRKDLLPVVNRAHDLQQRIAGGRKIRPQQLRALAQSTRTF